MENHFYICIDLKSFFASVECAEMGLDPFKTNLVVADKTRGTGSICLAVTPALKKLGVKNRCRLFEIPEGIEYIIAKPKMRKYMETSAKIYSIYLKFVAPEDIHVYSIDECFIDISPYLSAYEKTPKEFAIMLMNKVFEETGISASAGIGTNLFLAKVALDITAKHSKDSVGYLDEKLFKEQISRHRPITDIWNIGKGIAKRLKVYGVQDLEGVTRLSEQTLYREFGVNAEFLIDHAKGIEPCTIKDIQAYKAKSNSLSNSQILFEDYNFKDAKLVMKEMVDNLSLELVEKNLVTDSISLSIGYSNKTYSGGSKKLNKAISSSKFLRKEFEKMFDDYISPEFLVRKISIGFNNVVREDYLQWDLFSNTQESEKEKLVQKAVVKIKKKFGKNALLKGMNLEKKATQQIRNKLVGGHNGE
ncbi:MAG: DNA repair protein [Candidatus Melainabacteria bacterium]|nr:MAG: DNA repair protein [Candidatus Melainabacteria bacterium]